VVVGKFFIMKNILLFFYILINVVVLQGQSRFFHMTEDWETNTIQEYDTHYIAIGNGTTGPPNHIHFIRFTKLDKAGNFISSWNYSVGEMVTTEFRNQQSLNCFSNKKIMGISIETYPDFIVKGKRLHIDNQLTTVLDNTWEYLPENASRSISIATIQISNNRILQALNFSDTTDNKAKAVLIETDTLGNTTWESIFPCEGNQCLMEPRHIIPAHDGGYLYTNHEYRNYWQISRHIISTIIKVNSLGEEQWRIYPGGVGESYSSEEILLVPTDDGNYLCAWTDKKAFNGFSYQTNPEATLWFAKINENGEKLWEKNIKEEIEIWDIVQIKYLLTQMVPLSDGNIILTGTAILKLTQDANVIWGRSAVPPQLEAPYAGNVAMKTYGVIETSDGGLICTGEAQIQPGDDFPQYTQTGFVLKLDEYGCLEEGCHLDDPVVSVEEVVEESARMLVYPNPATDYVTINYKTTGRFNNISLIISDITGKIIYTRNLDIEQDEIIIPTSKYPNGQYFCTLKNNDQILTSKKIMLIK